MLARTLCWGVTALVLGARPSLAQVVQLPTFNFFSVQTTVSVPDSGRGFLAGIHRYPSPAAQRGSSMLDQVPGLRRFDAQRAAGVGVRADQMGISATVIDQQQAPAVSRREGLARRQSQSRNDHVARSSQEAAAQLSVEQLKQRHAQQQQQEELEAQALFERARRSEKDGRLGAARVLYAMVIRRSSGQLADAARARLEELK